MHAQTTFDTRPATWLPPAPASTRRLALSYSVKALSLCDAIVLKTSMRVLDHRTRHQWRCVDMGADVCVVPPASGSGNEGVLLLEVDAVTAFTPMTLTRPLHVRDIEIAFNRLGETLLHARAMTDTRPQRQWHENETFRLRRWPSSALLGTHERVMLATLMSAQPCSMASLHERSAVPEAACQDFVCELLQLDLLLSSFDTTARRPQAATRAPAEPVRPPPSPGLLECIRARLGLVPGRMG